MIAPHLYDFHYWFTSRPGPLSMRGVSMLLFVMVVMIIADVVLRVAAKKKRKVWDSLTKGTVRRIHNCLDTMAIFGLMLVFFNYEGIPVLGARYLLLVWGLCALIWGLSIAHEGYIRNKVKRAESIRKGELSKYFKKK